MWNQSNMVVCLDQNNPQKQFSPNCTTFSLILQNCQRMSAPGACQNESIAYTNCLQIPLCPNRNCSDGYAEFISITPHDYNRWDDFNCDMVYSRSSPLYTITLTLYWNDTEVYSKDVLIGPGDLSASFHQQGTTLLDDIIQLNHTI